MLSEYNLKAVVFDDNEKEAAPLIEALNYERIPSVYINFKDDERDDKKLKNIRIVFADLIIGNYQPGDDNNTVEAIRTSILDNIDDNNGPFILVVWSKHSSLADTLKNRLLEINPQLNFVVIKLDKNEYFESAENNKWTLKNEITFQDIKNDINKKLKDLNHLPIFLEWERDARGTVSKLLNDFIGDITNKEQVKNTISSAIKLTLGKNTDVTTKEKINSFYQTLNTTLADSIINNSNPIEQHEEFINSLDLETIDDNMKAEINRKTLFENPIDNELKTGNIYSFEDFKNNFSDDVLNEVCGYDNAILGRDFLRHNPTETKNEQDSIILRFCKTICPDILKSKGELKRDCKEFITNNTFLIIMDFTPSCDIAQTKYLKSRLIYGYIFKSDIKCISKKSESLYITDFHFQYKDNSRGLDGNYKLAFFIKNIFAVNPKKIKELTPMIRARKEFATDLQHSIANHISRIGISSLD